MDPFWGFGSASFVCKALCQQQTTNLACSSSSLPWLSLLKPLLPRLEIWEVRRRNQRGGASGIREVSRPAGQGTLERLCVLFRRSTIPAAPTCLAFSTFRGCSASAEGQEEGFARILSVASKIGKSSYVI